MKPTGWHKGSRFWGTGIPVVLLGAVLSAYLREPSPFIAVAAPFFTLAGLINVQERKNPEKGTEK